MADILKFQNANQLRDNDSLERELSEARQLIVALNTMLLEQQSVADVFCNGYKELEQAVKLLEQDRKHSMERFMFEQKRNVHLMEKLDALEWKYKEAMRWRYEGAD